MKITKRTFIKELKIKTKSKHELYEEAKNNGLKGRSKMSKQELAKALANK